MLTNDAVKETRAQVDSYREAYDILVAEDKVSKNFKTRSTEQPGWNCRIHAFKSFFVPYK